jgi:hypothetical protein
MPPIELIAGRKRYQEHLAARKAEILECIRCASEDDPDFPFCPAQTIGVAVSEAFRASGDPDAAPSPGMVATYVHQWRHSGELPRPGRRWRLLK